jgi:hypothetical protein
MSGNEGKKEKYVGDSGFNGHFVTFLAPTFVIIVSGSALNPCGHMLLNTGGFGGSYFHIGEVAGFPYSMNQAGYERYLLENNKIEISRTMVSISKPDAAKRKLSELLSNRWIWGVVPNNCVHFVEEVLQAGGSNFNLKSNCPTLGY